MPLVMRMAAEANLGTPLLPTSVLIFGWLILYLFKFLSLHIRFSIPAEFGVRFVCVGSVFFNSATLDAKKKKLFYFFILFSLKRFILHWTADAAFNFYGYLCHCLEGSSGVNLRLGGRFFFNKCEGWYSTTRCINCLSTHASVAHVCSIQAH